MLTKMVFPLFVTSGNAGCSCVAGSESPMIRNDDREPALTTSPLTRLYEGSRRSAPLRFLPVNQTARRNADLYCSSPQCYRAAVVAPQRSARCCNITALVGERLIAWTHCNFYWAASSPSDHPESFTWRAGSASGGKMQEARSAEGWQRVGRGWSEGYR